MALWSFKHHDLITVSDAIDIAEDATGDFYKFSAAEWKKHRYEVKTLLSLSGDEISQHVFALLSKTARATSCFEPKAKKRDFYFICLQDHQILKALKRDKQLVLLPLLVYVLTHELVHIVRFCNFSQRFEVTGKKKEEEETVVHTITFEILENLSMSELGYVLDSYRDHRICDMVAI